MLTISFRNLKILCFCICLSSYAFAQTPKLTLSASLSGDQKTLDVSITPASSAEGCAIRLYGAPQKWQVRSNDRTTVLAKIDGLDGASTLRAEDIEHLLIKGNKTSAKVFLRAQIKCGRKRKRSKITKLSLTRSDSGTLDKSPRKWLKDVKSKITESISAPTPTPTPGPPGSKWTLWNQDSYFRGANMVAWGDADEHNDYNLMTAQDFVDLKATGANVVQLSVAGIWKVKSPYGVRTTKQEELDKLVQWAKDAGLSYIIAVRSGPGRRDVADEDDDHSWCSSVWTNSAEQSKYGEMLAAMVSRYNSSQMVALNLTVEPNLGTCPNETVTSPEELEIYMNNKNISLKSIYETWIAKVRAMDASLPVIVQAGGWSAAHYFRVMEAVSDPYVIYDVHNYSPWGLTHEGSCSWPGNHDDPDSGTTKYWNKDHIDTYFQHVLTFQQEVSAPIYLGEFGINCHSGTTAYDYLKDQLDLTLNYGWHLSIWGWNNDHEMGLNKAPQNVQNFMSSVFDGTYNPDK